MYDYLGAHPLVVPCRAKELHFADRPRNAARGEQWYRSWFPLRSTLARVGRDHGAPRARCGEATPDLSRHHRIGALDCTRWCPTWPWSPCSGNRASERGATTACATSRGRGRGRCGRLHGRDRGRRREELAGGWTPAEGRRIDPQAAPAPGPLRRRATASGSTASDPTRSCSCAARTCSPTRPPPTAWCVATSDCPTRRHPRSGGERRPTVRSAGRGAPLARRPLRRSRTPELAELTGGAIRWP